MTKNGHIRDNPNPKGNVAILISPYIFFVHAFRMVLEHLPNAEFVPDFSSPVKGESYPEFAKEELRQYLKREGLFWRDLTISDRTPAEFFDKYAVLVTHMYSHGALISQPYNKTKRKVRISYGNAKESWTFGLPNAYFDLILCSGTYAQKKLSLYSAKVVPIGEPKLDIFFKAPKNKDQIIQEFNIPINPNMKTILYLPTWGSLSSLSIAVSSLVALTDRYNVIVKLHHVTRVFDPQDIAHVQGSSLIQLDGGASITDALQLADIVISDNSGGIFDAIATEKSLVLIDTIGEDEDFFVERPFYGFVGGRPGGVATHANSLEQAIKKADKQIAPVVTVPFGRKSLDSRDLENAIQQAGGSPYSERREALLEELYSYRDGESGKRAAHHITELLYDESERDKTMERLVDEFEQRVRKGVTEYLKTIEEKKYLKINELEKVKNLPYAQRARALRKIINEYF